MSLNAAFLEATEAVKKLKTTPTEDELLNIYSLYKQAKFGDCDKPKPGIFDIRGRYKWDAWNRLKGMDEDTAKKKYIEYVEQIIKKYGQSKTVPEVLHI